MKRRLFLIGLATIFSSMTGTGHGQILQTAHVGYVYPAGGQAGTTFEVVAGGKGLARIEAIHVSGTGVNVRFIEHVSNYKRKLQEQIRHVGREKSGKPMKEGQDRKFGPPPDHEMYTRLEELSAREFKQVAGKFASKERVQRNRELDELVIMEVSIDANAPAGIREVTLLSRTGGASNPVRFMVNTLPEAREHEPNDLNSPPETHLETPFIMNGQIMPGDEDRFSFAAIEGQELVVSVRARELIPFLADAVPGWFQAVVSVLDDKGNELAYADDFFFNPDPAFLFKVPRTGTYHVLIRDSIYRGREDFVYRVAVGEIPFVTGIFPLGAESGSKASVSLYGWNLPGTKLSLDTSPEGRNSSEIYFVSDGLVSNTVRYALGSLPESVEEENNDTIKKASVIEPQTTVNGRIGKPGDVDFYRFKARKGQTYVLSIAARSLNSPLDSMLRVFDDDSRILGWSDDLPASGNLTDRTGLLTHSADSRLEFTAPARGSYYIQVSDTQHQGGETHAYRLSLAQPAPNYEVYVTPSTITIPGPAGGLAMLHVRRSNGFEGPVDVDLWGASTRLQLSGGRIPAGQQSTAIVFNNGQNTGGSLERLHLTASAVVNGKQVSKPVIPADEVTQAFITHHLVEAQELNVYVTRGMRQQPVVRLKDPGSMVLTAGKPVRLNVTTGKLPRNFSKPIFELESAPAGLTLETSSKSGKSTLELSMDETPEASLEGNLVVGVYFEVSPRSKDGKGRTRKIFAGMLPAIPYRTQ